MTKGDKKHLRPRRVTLRDFNRWINSGRHVSERWLRKVTK